MIGQMKSTRGITADMTVNEVVAEYPEMLVVFRRHGIDACCGGALSLAETARKYSVDFIAILGTLDRD